MRNQPAIRAICVILGFLNLIILVDFIIFFNTGYYAFFARPRHELAVQLIGLTCGCTFLFLAVAFLRSLFSLRHRTRRRNKSIIAFTAFTSALIYGWFGLILWVSSLFQFAEIGQVTSYPSPSSHIEVVFKKETYAFSAKYHCEVYKNIGIFQKQIQMEFIDDISYFSSDEELQEEYVNAFHDPSKLKLEWSADESRLDLKVKVRSGWIEGFIEVAEMGEK